MEALAVIFGIAALVSFIVAMGFVDSYEEEYAGISVGVAVLCLILAFVSAKGLLLPALAVIACALTGVGTTIGAIWAKRKLFAKYTGWRKLRAAIKARSARTLIARCKAGIKKAQKFHQGDISAFIFATEKLLDMLRDSLGRLAKLEEILGENSTTIDASETEVNSLYAEVDFKEVLGDFAGKLSGSDGRLVELERRLKAVIQGIVFISENLWIATSETMFGREAKLVAELQEAVANLLEQIELSMSERESALSHLETLRLHTDIARAMEDDTYLEAGRGRQRETN